MIRSQRYPSILPILAGVETVFLTGAFISGLATLLYSSFPITSYIYSSILSTHVSFAVLSGIFGVVLFATVMKLGNSLLKILGALNFALLGLAGVGGLLFYGTYEGIFSYLMAISFFASYCCTVGCLFYTL